MTHSEQNNAGPEWLANPEQVELTAKILNDCQVFAKDIPRHVAMHYGRPDTPVAMRILEDTAVCNMYFTNGLLPQQSKYFYENPIGGYAGVAVRKVRLPDEAKREESRPEVGYRGRIIDLSLSGDPDNMSPWQCSLYLREGQQPVLIDQDLVRSLGPEIGDNTVTNINAITDGVPYGAAYYPNNDELRTLGHIIEVAHMTQRDLATTLRECATEATSSQNIPEARWFNAGAAHIDRLIQQQLER